MLADRGLGTRSTTACRQSVEGKRPRRFVDQSPWSDSEAILSRVAQVGRFTAQPVKAPLLV
jgi:hypothetical protein